MQRIDCPFGSEQCPHVKALDERIDALEANQLKLMHLLYYIAGIVSVSLGVTVMI